MLIHIGIKNDTFTWEWTVVQTESDWMNMLTSLPWFFIELADIGWKWVISQMDSMDVMRSRRGYWDMSVDEDVQILQFKDEEYTNGIQMDGTGVFNMHILWNDIVVSHNYWLVSLACYVVDIHI